MNLKAIGFGADGRFDCRIVNDDFDLPTVVDEHGNEIPSERIIVLRLQQNLDELSRLELEAVLDIIIV